MIVFMIYAYTLLFMNTKLKCLGEIWLTDLFDKCLYVDEICVVETGRHKSVQVTVKGLKINLGEIFNFGKEE